MNIWIIDGSIYSKWKLIYIDLLMIQIVVVGGGGMKISRFQISIPFQVQLSDLRYKPQKKHK